MSVRIEYLGTRENSPATKAKVTKEMKCTKTKTSMKGGKFK